LLWLCPTLPIVVTTGFGGSMTPNSARALGIRALISKPATAEMLAKAVRDALDGTRPGGACVESR
jgi:DNA-binding NarL/FixJ family response regulator